MRGVVSELIGRVRSGALTEDELELAKPGMGMYERSQTLSESGPQPTSVITNISEQVLAVFAEKTCLRILYPSQHTTVNGDAWSVRIVGKITNSAE